MLGRVAPIADCPFCHKGLVPGACELRPLNRFWGLVASTVLEFSHELTGYDILEKAEVKASYYCEACGAVIILDERVSV